MFGLIDGCHAMPVKFNFILSYVFVFVRLEQIGNNVDDAMKDACAKTVSRLTIVTVVCVDYSWVYTHESREE